MNNEELEQMKEWAEGTTPQTSCGMSTSGHCWCPICSPPRCPGCGRPWYGAPPVVYPPQTWPTWPYQPFIYWSNTSGGTS